MKSSLEIAQEAELEPIDSLAQRIGLEPAEVEPYGRYKAKVPLEVLDRLGEAADGKLICVAGVTPTRAGEGKTTTAVGLTEGPGSSARSRCSVCASPRSGRCSGSRAAPPGAG